MLLSNVTLNMICIVNYFIKELIMHTTISVCIVAMLFFFLLFTIDAEFENSESMLGNLKITKWVCLILSENN